MTKTILLGASMLAIITALPAFAAETAVKADTSAEVKVENALDKTGDAISNAANKTEEAVKNTYSDVKAYFSDDDDLKVMSSINVASRNTADALLGTGVQNAEGKTIGEIHDVLVDAEGDAETVIIQDTAGLLGVGSKLAAFDFDVIEGYNKNQDVVVKLTEQSIKAAKPFEYDAAAAAKSDVKMSTIPAGQFSLSKILDADVIGPDGKKVADVETVAFDGDDADYIIVAFNQIMGMGGEKAALNMEALDLVDKDGKYSFRLNSAQTAQFETYKTKSN